MLRKGHRSLDDCGQKNIAYIACQVVFADFVYAVRRIPLLGHIANKWITRAQCVCCLVQGVSDTLEETS